MAEKAIILSRVSSLKQDLVQQTDEVLKTVRNDGFKDNNIIIIEDKESAIKLSEEERRGLNEMKRVINEGTFLAIMIPVAIGTIINHPEI